MRVPPPSPRLTGMPPVEPQASCGAALYSACACAISWLVPHASVHVSGELRRATEARRSGRSAAPQIRSDAGAVLRARRASTQTSAGADRAARSEIDAPAQGG